jgi:propanol-preferring alcohol dehydrogenase
VSGEGVLIKVGGAGICRTYLEFIDGYFEKYVPVKLPFIPGHEIAGWVEEIGNSVPEGIIEKGDWICGYCLTEKLLKLNNRHGL